MRAGGNCAVQQALTAEAAGVVKQAVVLARRRGHAQVTPLHVANTMLAAASGVFRLACLESHSHPLQCKALELCFNVALNRLPASSAAAPHNYSPNPSISNALVAAFKRAQAHQRRGTMESQQQPLLAVKIELEQLIVSILDDPSVSRVMREAGFSSTQVKVNVEKATSLQLSSPSPILPKQNPILTLPPSSPPPTNPDPVAQTRDEDMKAVIDTLLMSKNNKRSVVLVGESTATLEATVKAVMDRVERGEVPESLREVKFISIPPLYTFCNLQRDQVEQKIRELTCLVQSLVRKGVVLYLGDLKWISDYRVRLEREGSSYYCSVEHMIMEVGRLVWGTAELERFWVMGIATFQTYLRCRNNGYNSLQTVWGLHPLTIPVDSLAFTLLSHTDDKSERRAEKEETMNGISCCVECWEKLEEEAREVQESANEKALSRLPCWLKDESRRVVLNDKDQKCEAMRELYKKWNSFCNSTHKQEKLQLKEFNAENLKQLCEALEEKVPWQKQIIPEIAGTILQCRSGMLTRRSSRGQKEDTWLLFLGEEARAKEKMARELAKIVFGSYSRFHSIGMSSFLDHDNSGNKRGRDESGSYYGRFAAAAAADPRRVFLVEDFEQSDYCSQMGIKRAIENGSVVVDGDELGLCDAIVILSCESFSSRSTPSASPTLDRKAEGGGFLDLNVCSIDEEGDDDLGVVECVDRRVMFKTLHLQQ